MTSVVIDPRCEFSALRVRLDSLRWRLVSAATRPILPGEPEHAVFERDAGERTHYTFNPVCRLRVLEFTDGPDAVTRAALPAASAEDVASWLGSTDERTVLRGLLAAKINPEPRFAERAAALRQHSRSAIARAATLAGDAIAGRGPDATRQPMPPPLPASTRSDADDQSRLAALALGEFIKAQVEPLLRALARDVDGGVVASLRPRPEDYARVFIPDAVDAARGAYETVWAEPPRIETRGSSLQLECHVAPAGMLTYDNELSKHFPGGYRHIGHLLDPHRTWVRWKYLRPGQTSGMAFDGLVWCDDHWAWFPKPFRALAQLAK
jgi:hypothetical protein